MCPACITNAAVAVAGTVSAGGLTALVSRFVLLRAVRGHPSPQARRGRSKRAANPSNGILTQTGGNTEP
jgi:hypothetical protein